MIETIPKKMFSLGEKRGEKRGKKIATEQIAKTMLKQGLDISLIVKITGLSEATLKKLK